MMDTILIRGLEVYAYHGVHAAEKRDGQPFIFDIDAGFDTRRAGETDRVADTVSYSDMIRTVTQTATAASYDLIERLAAAVAEALLVAYPLERVTVRVKKPRAPITAAFDYVGVEITRARETAPSAKQALLGLGANLGDREATLKAATEAIAALPDTRVLAVSALYETAPWGYADQPDYLNAVVRVETGLSAPALLGALLGIEAMAGRRRSFKNAPRPLDVDLLMMEGERRNSPELTLPHPRMGGRAFVLVPALDVCPDGTFDGTDLAALAAAADRSGVRTFQKKP